MRRTTVIIPCYNEAQRLDLAAFRDWAAREEAVSLLFVDDGSTDETARVLGELCASNPEAFSALILERNQGKAEAVRRGFIHAFESAPDLLGFWDADLATPLDDISTFRDIIDTKPHLEMVFGSRVNLLGRAVHRRLIRHYIGRFFATAASFVLHLPIYDTQCGAKMFRVSEHMRSLFAEPFLSRWVFDVELLARRNKLARENAELPQTRDVIYEHPLDSWHDVKGSKLKLADFFIVAIDLIRIRTRYGRGS